MMDFHSCSEVTTDTKCHRGQITCFDIQQEGREVIIYIHRCYHENIQVLFWFLTRMPSTAYPRGCLLTFLILSPPGSCCELIWQKPALLPFGKPRQQWQNRTDSIWLCVCGRMGNRVTQPLHNVPGGQWAEAHLSHSLCKGVSHTHTNTHLSWVLSDVTGWSVGLPVSHVVIHTASQTTGVAGLATAIWLCCCLTVNAPLCQLRTEISTTHTHTVACFSLSLDLCLWFFFFFFLPERNKTLLYSCVSLCRGGADSPL